MSQNKVLGVYLLCGMSWFGCFCEILESKCCFHSSSTFSLSCFALVNVCLSKCRAINHVALVWEGCWGYWTLSGRAVCQLSNKMHQSKTPWHYCHQKFSQGCDKKNSVTHLSVMRRNWVQIPSLIHFFHAKRSQLVSLRFRMLAWTMQASCKAW